MANPLNFFYDIISLNKDLSILILKNFFFKKTIVLSIKFCNQYMHLKIQKSIFLYN